MHARVFPFFIHAYTKHKTMSRFNTTATAPTKTKNLAGGEAYTQTPELELVSILLTSFAKDDFYRTAPDTFARLIKLINQCDKKFVAQAAIYARTEFGMRSITHVVASELAKHIGGVDWGKRFYERIIHRPDDMMEILSYHKTVLKGKISHAMMKGFAKAFDKFNGYQLAKYRGEQKAFKLIDVVNLVHPKPVEQNAEAIKQLVAGELKSVDTWESELTKAGQTASTDDEKSEFKRDVWVKLIREKKIGYFALLRNLRNIIEQAPDVIDEAIEMLTDEKLIKKSLVLPFRYTTAYGQIEQMGGSKDARKVMIALNIAVDIAVNNVPKFDGDTLVVLDISSSMRGKPSQIGSLFAAIMIKRNNPDFMVFDGDARYINVNPNDSTITIANAIRYDGGSTNFHSIFARAKRKYDRVIILSDMQGWVGRNAPTATFDAYRKETGANPFVYSFDLQGYGTMQFPQPRVLALAGFSEKVFDIMKFMEQDKLALVNTIKEVDL